MMISTIHFMMIMSIGKKIKRVGKPKLGGASVTFEYRKGNLVSKANTVDVQFDNSRYRIIAHLDTGYITLDEV